MVLQILSYLHRKGFRHLLVRICQVAYFIKGYGKVKSAYHQTFRAYEYRVKGVTYLSMGPGWAYTFSYLRDSLKQSFCYFFTPQSGDCVVDIGAGLGEETVIFALQVGETGKVISIEANPSTFKGLQYLVEQNGFIWTVPLHLAIFDKDGEVTIEDDEENYLTNTINGELSTKTHHSVKAQTLDTLVKENSITKIDFLKSNIEGAEQYLIKGMDESVNIIKNVCISCHDFRHNYHQHGEFYITKEKVIAFFNKHDFEVTFRNTGDRVVDEYIYARNTRIK